MIGIIYASLACLAQTDMKRLIAFSSVGHMGFVMLAISTLTEVGINAAIIGMVAHGVITGLLFFIAGSMSHRYHTREMSRLGGSQKLIPIMAGIFGFTAMASLGLPGLAGFWGEFMALLGSYNPMSGLSLGVLVVEAGETSGAMITAQQALEQNREVFAIPGSILSSASSGPNHLVQEGAKLVRDYTDILEELNLTAVAHQMELKEVIPASETESLLLKRLSAEPTHIDQVCRSSGLPISTVSSTLAMMELKGLVKQVGAMNYALARESREEYRVKVD